MKKHSFYSKIQPTSLQLLRSAADAWLEYSLNKTKLKTSNNVTWKCFRCSKPIHVKYNTTSVKDMYCVRCRPKVLRYKTGLLIRYFSQFKEKVRNQIMKNTGL